jgi:ankyrin repeat protein
VSTSTPPGPYLDDPSPIVDAAEWSVAEWLRSLWFTTRELRGKALTDAERHAASRALGTLPDAYAALSLDTAVSAARVLLPLLAQAAPGDGKAPLLLIVDGVDRAVERWRTETGRSARVNSPVCGAGAPGSRRTQVCSFAHVLAALAGDVPCVLRIVAFTRPHAEFGSIWNALHLGVADVANRAIQRIDCFPLSIVTGGAGGESAEQDVDSAALAVAHQIRSMIDSAIATARRSSSDTAAPDVTVEKLVGAAAETLDAWIGPAAGLMRLVQQNASLAGSRQSLLEGSAMDSVLGPLLESVVGSCSPEQFACVYRPVLEVMMACRCGLQAYEIVASVESARLSVPASRLAASSAPTVASQGSSAGDGNDLDISKATETTSAATVVTEDMISTAGLSRAVDDLWALVDAKYALQDWKSMRDLHPTFRMVLTRNAHELGPATLSPTLVRLDNPLFCQWLSPHVTSTRKHARASDKRRGHHALFLRAMQLLPERASCSEYSVWSALEHFTHSPQYVFQEQTLGAPVSLEQDNHFGLSMQQWDVLNTVACAHPIASLADLELVREPTVVEMMMNCGFSPNIKSDGPEKRPFVHVLAAYGRERSLRSLLRMQVDLSAVDATGRTVTHAVIVSNRRRALRRLLRAGAPVDVADASGVTPLMLACSTGSAEMIRPLVHFGADVCAVDHRGCSPLWHAACDPEHTSKCEECVAELLRCWGDLEKAEQQRQLDAERRMAEAARAEEEARQAALIAARMRAVASRDLVRQQLETGLNPESAPMAAQHAAASEQQSLPKGCTSEVSESAQSHEHASAQLETCRQDPVPFWRASPVDRLMRAALDDVEADATESNMPFPVPCRRIDIHQVDRQTKRSPWLIAALRGSAQMLDAMWSYAQIVPGARADFDARGCDDELSLLPSVAALGHVEAMKFLIAMGAPVQGSDARNQVAGSRPRGAHNCRPESVPLVYAAANAGHLDMVDLLLQSGASAEAVYEERGETSLHVAAVSGRVDILRRIWKHVTGRPSGARAHPHVRSDAANDFLERKNPAGLTALWIACYAGQVDALSALLSFGARPNAVTPKGILATLVAAEHPRHAELLAVLASSPWPGRAVSQELAAGADGSTNHGDDCATMSSSGGWAIDAQDNKGRSAVWYAAFLGNADLLERLVKAGANLSIADAEHQSTPLMAAVNRNAVECVRFLVAHVDGEQLLTQTNEGQSAVLMAVAFKYEQCLAALLAHPNRNAVCQAVNMAAEEGGQTPLLTSICLEHTGGMMQLLAAGADTNAADGDGMTALLAVARHGGATKLDLASLLVNDAVRRGGTAAAAQLMRARDRVGRGILHHIAISSGDEQSAALAEMLLALRKDGREGAVTSVFTGEAAHDGVLGETRHPLDAEVDGDAGTLGDGNERAELIDVDAVDDTGATALCYACNAGCDELAKVLLEHGARVQWPPNRSMASSTFLFACISRSTRLVARLLAAAFWSTRDQGGQSQATAPPGAVTETDVEFVLTASRASALPRPMGADIRRVLQPLLDSGTRLWCAVCLAAPVALHCPCTRVYYCGAECQRQHWDRAHKKVCPLRKRKATQTTESEAPAS